MLLLLQELRTAIRGLWLSFNLETKLLAAATVVVSLITTAVAFWAVHSIQLDAQMNDTRFGRDLGLLLSANVAPLIAEDNLTEVSRFSHRFYSSTTSIRYMLYADTEGEIFLGIPYSQPEVRNSLTIARRIQLPEDYAKNPDIPLVRQHKTPDGVVTDVFIPLVYDGTYLGTLSLGINPNPTIVNSSNLTRDVTIAVFVAIWAMMIIGAVFNALTITKPIKELLGGVRNIALGNFKQRIDLSFGGELSELIHGFNDMAQRLESYDEQNIEELTAEKAKLETLVTTIADGAVLLNPDLHIVLANPSARRIFGWDHVARGESILPLLPMPVRAEVAEQLLAMVKGEGVIGEDAPLKDGAEFRLTLTDPKRTLRISLFAVLDANRENVKSVAMTIQDVTREAELNDAKSQFISNVSHELRTPLFNIKSFIETLHDYGDDLTEEERKEFLMTANNETDRLTRLVNDVLDLSRLESSRGYQFDAVDIAQAIDQTLRTYQLNARDKGIELSHEIQADLPAVLGNYDLLLQIFANFVGNALKFTRSGGKVLLRSYQLDGAMQRNSPRCLGGAACDSVVRIEVSDTGIGIDPEDQEAIFDRFFRVENRVHTLEGTGLGLSIVRNIVDRHQSKVHLISEVGVGTTFWVDFAVHQGASAPEGPAMQPIEAEGIRVEAR
jgi:two-component system, OmpR family, sensor histidine kinase NblS